MHSRVNSDSEYVLHAGVDCKVQSLSSLVTNTPAYSFKHTQLYTLVQMHFTAKFEQFLMRNKAF